MPSFILSNSIFAKHWKCRILTNQFSDPYLSHDGVFERHTLALIGVDSQDLVIDLLVEGHSARVVEYRKEMGLDGVRIGGLTEDLEKGGIGHEEESGDCSKKMGIWNTDKIDIWSSL